MSFLSVLFAEYRAIFNNRVVMIVIFVGSMVYGILYPMPYLNDNVTAQNLIIVDEDKSTLSNELVFLVSATPQITLLREVGSLEEAKNLVENFEASGILFIPKGFEANAQMGAGSVVSYMGNASYFLIYGAIVEGVKNALDSLSEQLYRQKNSNLLTPNIISYEAIALYNPSLGYINYALAAVLVFILHQTLIGGSAILGAYQNRIARDYKKLLDSQDSNSGTESTNLNKQKSLSAQIPYFLKSPLPKLVAARIFAFGSIYFVWFLLYFGVFFPLFGVNIHASISDFWCFAGAFILCCGACGTLLGACLKDESIPTQIVFISSMPLVFIMGFIWPSELLPSFLQFLAELIPAYHGIRGFISLNQMGAEFSSVMPHFYALLGLFVLCFVASVLVLKKKREILKKM
ncbi:ABC transporter permease [Helicobacter himalayensis]|uniref:ABC transporter permease n=1 Tax=Helicobacter himalayensis TaxID=1591088 RepID=UPI003D7012F4